MTFSQTVQRGRAGYLRLVLAAGLLFATFWFLPAPASAHASLVSTDPAEGAVLAEPPQQITLTFDEPVRLAASSAQLYDAQGQEVGADARSVDRKVTLTPTADMPEGTYVLTYRVVSADSHPIAGSLSFSVGAPSETVVPPGEATADAPPAVRIVQGVAQGVTYVALFLAAGVAIFLVVLLPASAVLENVRRRLHRVIHAATAVAAVGALLLVPIGVVYQQGLGLAGLATSLPWASWISADGLLAAGIVLGLTAAAWALRANLPSRVRQALVLAGAGLALAAVALVGHTRSYGPGWLVVTSDVVHVLAATIWFGGLVGLAVTLPGLAKRAATAAAVLARFSTVAGALLALVALAGVLLGWRILGSWGGLFSTAYGLVLVAKTVLVSAVVAVAGWNRYRLLPQVQRALGHRERVDSSHRLSAAVRVEAMGLVVVLALTGFLVNQVPRDEPAVAASQPSTETAVADDIRVVAHLAPGRVGSNTLHVQVQNLAGEPIEPFAEPAVSVGSEDVDLGGRPVRNVASGTYQSDVVLPGPGAWQVQVSVRTGEFDNPVVTLQTTVAP